MRMSVLRELTLVSLPRIAWVGWAGSLMTRITGSTCQGTQLVPRTRKLCPLWFGRNPLVLKNHRKVLWPDFSPSAWLWGNQLSVNAKNPALSSGVQHVVCANDPDGLPVSADGVQPLQLTRCRCLRLPRRIQQPRYPLRPRPCRRPRAGCRWGQDPARRSTRPRLPDLRRCLPRRNR